MGAVPAARHLGAGMTRATRHEPDPSETSARPDPSGLRGKRILYVEDDPSVRWATNDLLREAGAICLLAASHDQAVTLAAAEPQLALAILDFQMPDGDVGQLVKRLRAVRAGLPLIGTSGADARNDFAARGVTRFLEKPWELADLARIMEGADPYLQHVASLDPRAYPPSLRD